MKMSGITDVVIAFLDLLEAEGRALRRGIMRLGWGLALMLLAVLLALAAAGFFLAGVYLYFASQLPPALSALLVSLLTALLALVIAGAAYWRTR